MGEIRAKDLRMVPIGDIKPSHKNRNAHPDEQIQRLKEVIRYQGFRAPLIISNRTGLLIAGHGRLEAAKGLGMQELPCLFQDFDSAEQEYAAGISDNSIASWSELDLKSIGEDILDFGPSFNTDLLGIKDFVIDPSEKMEDAEPKVSTPIECPSCGHKFFNGESEA